MNLVSKALIGAAAIALLGGCGMFSKSDSTSSSSTDTASNTAPSTVPSANLPPMTATTPVEGGMPASADTNAAPAATAIALSEVQNPKQTLAHATVKDIKGEAVGEVKSVRVGKDGKVASVSVAVGKRTFALKSDTLTYVQAENTIMSQQSKAEITKTK